MSIDSPDSVVEVGRYDVGDTRVTRIVDRSTPKPYFRHTTLSGLPISDDCSAC